MKRALTVTQANAAIDAIVEHCGAREDERADMRHYFTKPADDHEYRFRGNLGFGGKLYLNGNGLYVGYYPEDQNGARDAMALLANNALREVFSGI